MTSDTADLLVEIGCEELPTQQVMRYSHELADVFGQQLKQQRLQYTSMQALSSPRRIAIAVKQLDRRQAATQNKRKGPMKNHAFDAQGKPRASALGFAKSLGVEVADLSIANDGKGDYLYFIQQQNAIASETLIIPCLQNSLKKLSHYRLMRFGDHQRFLRPVHWVMLRWDNALIPGEILGCQTQAYSYGHRFLAPGKITIDCSEHYQQCLEKQGKVIACPQKRRQRIADQLQQLASEHAALLDTDNDLLDEVTQLVEWPVAILGSFAKRFLALPKSVLQSSLKQHQKSFLLLDKKKQVRSQFISIANIESKNPARVKRGYERVVKARLEDAYFFYQQDCKTSIKQWLDKLKQRSFQAKLGSLYQRSERISQLAAYIAKQLGEDENTAKRAGLLCKMDLSSQIVAEFPELQGTMGGHYAAIKGESATVAQAIAEHYQPRSANDGLPSSALGAIVAIADKIDTLVGIFSLGKAPSGEKDPYALRRAALALLRIQLDRQWDLSLNDLITTSLQHYQLANDKKQLAAVKTFITQRQRYYYQEKNIAADSINAIFSCPSDSSLNDDKRLYALVQFRQNPSIASLINTHKRCHNLLRKNASTVSTRINDSQLVLAEEKKLVAKIKQITPLLASYRQQKQYAKSLATLATLAEPLDDFFQHVKVMTQDAAIRQNRLAILNSLHHLLLSVADFAKLST